MAEVVRLGIEIDMSDQSAAGLQRTIAQLERAKALMADMRAEAAKTGATLRATMTPTFGLGAAERRRAEQQDRDWRARNRRSNRAAAQEIAQDWAKTHQSIADKTRESQARSANAAVQAARVTTARVASVTQQGQQRQVQTYQLHNVAMQTATRVGGQRVLTAVQQTNAAVARAQTAGYRTQQVAARANIAQMAQTVARAALPGRLARAQASSRRALAGPHIGGAVMGGLRAAFSLPAIAAGYATGQAAETAFINPIRTADELTRMRIATEQLFKARGYPGNPADFQERVVAQAIKLPGSAQELMTSARTLLSYGFTPERVLPTAPTRENPGLLQMIGDISAMVGPEVAPRIALALGQINTAGRLNAQDLRQLSEAGVPVYKYIAGGLTSEFGAKEGGRVFTEGDVRQLAERNQIGVQRALGYIERGVVHDFGGTAERVSGEQAGGVMQQIQDFVRYRVAERWGAGLRRGLLPALKEMNAALDDGSERSRVFRDGLEGLGERVGTGLADTARTLLSGFERMDWRRLMEGPREAGQELGTALAQGVVRSLQAQFAPDAEAGKSLTTQAFALGQSFAVSFTTGVVGSLDPGAIARWLWDDITKTLASLTFNPGAANTIGGTIARGLEPGIRAEMEARNRLAGPQDRALGGIDAGAAQVSPGAEPPPGAERTAGALGGAIRRGFGAVGGLLGPSKAEAAELGGTAAPGASSGLLTMAQSSGNQALAQDLARRGYPASVISQICGPLAVAGLARAYGVNVSPADVAAEAEARGEFSRGSGVTNATAFLPNALRQAGLTPINLERQQALQALQNNRPVAINTPAHYYLGQGYDPSTGLIDLGNTGEAMGRLGGSRYMTLSQIEAISGGLYGFTGVGPGQGGSGRTGGLSLGSNSPELRAMARRVAGQYGLDPELFERQIQQESNFNPRAVSQAGALGLGQLMPATARGLGVNDPFDPAENLAGSARFMRENLDRFGGDYESALRAYNAGPGRVAESRSFRETNDYVRNILGTGGNNAPLGGTIGAQGGVAALSGAGGASGVSVAPGAVVINVLDVRAIDPAVLNQVGNALVDVIAQKLGGKVNEMAGNFGMAGAGP